MAELVRIEVDFTGVRSSFMRPFKDKGVLITGAGRGIGKRLAIGFAQAGARVGLLARSKAELDLADLEIEHAGGTSLRLRADVREYEQISAAVDRMKAHYGGIHVLVCAAGIQGPIGPFADSDPKSWADVPMVNLIGAVHACRAVLPHMIEKRSGKIILLTGGGAESARPNFSAYAASKAALVRFAETLAEEVRDNNVQINCMNPGRTYTNMTDEILRAGDRAGSREMQEASLVRTNGGIAPDRQIQLALFLASERSNHISGKLLGIQDDWKRLEHSNLPSEQFTLRRLQRV
jgi:NAD(P)-dependent dehydrogenase (short-subunit alcohol dehydrogenase family)